MSNISRRQFLKSAGVAALAVAALTGCKKLPDTDIPDVPGVTSVDLRVLFVDEKGNPVGNSVTGVYETTVLKDAKKYDPKLIPADKLPKGYVLYSTDKVDIISDSTPMIAKVVVKPDYKDTMRVKINLVFEGEPNNKREFYAEVKRGLKEIEFKDIKDQLYATYDDIVVADDNAANWFSFITDSGNGYVASTMPLPVKHKA